MKRLIIFVGLAVTVWALYSDPGPLQSTLRVGPGQAAVDPAVTADPDISPMNSVGARPPVAVGRPVAAPAAQRPAPRLARLGPAEAAPELAEPTPLYVTGTSVNLRGGPGTQYRALGRATRSDQVGLLARSGDWMQVRLPNGRSAWMHGDYLSERKPAVLQQARTRSVAAPTSTELARAAQAMIDASIASYPGPCPCDYSTARDGSRCGKRSAWSKPGGYEPLCYPSDISPQRIATAAARARGATN